MRLIYIELGKTSYTIISKKSSTSNFEFNSIGKISCIISKIKKRYIFNKVINNNYPVQITQIQVAFLCNLFLFIKYYLAFFKKEYSFPNYS